MQFLLPFEYRSDAKLLTRSNHWQNTANATNDLQIADIFKCWLKGIGSLPFHFSIGTDFITPDCLRITFLTPDFDFQMHINCSLKNVKERESSGDLFTDCKTCRVIHLKAQPNKSVLSSEKSVSVRGITP
jgi:hypothetical protein